MSTWREIKKSKDIRVLYVDKDFRYPDHEAGCPDLRRCYGASRRFIGVKVGDCQFASVGSYIVVEKLELGRRIQVLSREVFDIFYSDEEMTHE